MTTTTHTENAIVFGRVALVAGALPEPTPGR
jgi:hypothetical protein